MERYRLVENWVEDDLTDLPVEENEYYEYKSSETPTAKLKEKIAVAASAFWNSGGGIFIAGINDEGQIDGGIPETIGRQKLRDWVDQSIARVEPPGPYIIQIIGKGENGSSIKEGNVVLVVGFGESITAPHMAPDKRYYLRAGAHSGPASHFLVEAIRLRRSLQRPLLRGVLIPSTKISDVIQLVIVCLNEATALNVKISLDPLPKGFSTQGLSKHFPLEIPVIDRIHPLTMDIAPRFNWENAVGGDFLNLKLEYQDIADRQFKEDQTLDFPHNLAPAIYRESGVL